MHVHHLLLVYQQFYGNPMALVKAAQAQVTFELDAISSINCISVRADMKRNKNDPHLLNLTIPCEHTHTHYYLPEPADETRLNVPEPADDTRLKTEDERLIKSITGGQRVTG